MKVSISKSVSRTFRILAEFREARVPLSFLSMAKRLGDPKTSVFAALKHLTAIGLLRFDGTRGEYFPTYAVYELGSWLHDSLLISEPLQALVDEICRQTDHDTVLTARNLIFNNILLVRSPTSTSASSIRLQPGSGVGLTLCNSTVGHVILAQLSDTEVRRIWGHQEHWARSQHGIAVPDFDAMAREIRLIRKRGYDAGYDRWLPGTGAVAYPLRLTLTGCPLAISVTGPSDRIRPREAKLRAVIEHQLRQFEAEMANDPEA